MLKVRGVADGLQVNIPVLAYFCLIWGGTAQDSTCEDVKFSFKQQDSLVRQIRSSVYSSCE